MTNVRKKGFTLIEIMVVVAIVALLAALAVPAFLDSIRKSRRAEAMRTIMDIHLAQERWRVNHPLYATLTELGFSSPQLSEGGHYSVQVALPFSASGKATTYTITATAQSPQDSDSCGDFVLANAAGVLNKTTTKGLTDRCWTK